MSGATSLDVLMAIYAGDAQKIEGFIGDGYDLGTLTPTERWSFLHKALQLPHRSPSVEMVAYLLGKGLDVNGRDYHQWTPLHLAARQKDVAVMGALLDAGAEVDAVNDEGLTPLRIALTSGPIARPCLELLLDRGADLGHTLKGRTVRDFIGMIAHGDHAWLLELCAAYPSKGE